MNIIPGLDMAQIQKLKMTNKDIPVTIGLKESSAHCKY